MQISSPSKNQLVINLSQNLMRLIGLFFILLGGGMTVAMLASFELSCSYKTDADNQCQLTTNYFFFYQSTRHLQNIKQATVITKKNSKGNYNYYVALQSEHKNTRLNSMPTPSQEKCARAAAQINAFLQNSDTKTLQIDSLLPIWLKFFPMIFPVVGFFMLLLTSRITIIFNKSANQLKIQRKNLINRTETFYPLDKIEDIAIQKSYDNKGQAMYRVALIMQDNTEVPLTQAYDSLLKPKIKLAKTINDFLGLHCTFTT